MKNFIITLSIFACIFAFIYCVLRLPFLDQQFTIVAISPLNSDEIMLEFNDGHKVIASVEDSLYCVKVGDCFTKKTFGSISLNNSSAAKIEITDKSVTGNEIAYMFDNGDMVIITGNEFFYYDRFGRLNRIRKLSTEGERTWCNCEVGQTGRLTFSYDLPIVMDPLLDYSKERVVVKVNKYDGHHGEIDGKISINGGFLFGSSGTGEISGEFDGGEDFIINLYFEDGPPVSVNAKDNPLWRDIVPGSKVLETRRHGKKYYMPLL